MCRMRRRQGLPGHCNAATRSADASDAGAILEAVLVEEGNEGWK